jgi:hypothetical protein
MQSKVLGSASIASRSAAVVGSGRSGSVSASGTLVFVMWIGAPHSRTTTDTA